MQLGAGRASQYVEPAAPRAFLRADLRGAGLREADLQGANLRWANLRWADLPGANLRGARLPAASMVLLADWGDLSDETTIALMRLDASAHPDPGAFDYWAETGDCPYGAGVPVQRVASFQERREIWSSGPPPTIWSALCMVLDEKCPGWREE